MRIYHPKKSFGLQQWPAVNLKNNYYTVSDLNKRIEEALDEIRPFLANDGGDVSLEGVEGATVKVKFHGACVGCKVSDFTLKGGIEATIKRYVPEIDRVIAVDA